MVCSKPFEIEEMVQKIEKNILLKAENCCQENTPGNILFAETINVLFVVVKYSNYQAIKYYK